MEEIISNIRACLISCKGSVPIKQLQRDYMTLVGERIPYSKLGFPNLESLMLSIPSLLVTNCNGEYYVDAKASEKTNHITEMVKKQKSGKPKKPPRTLHWNKKFCIPRPAKWNPPNVSNTVRKYKHPQRSAVTSHNQLVMKTPPKKNVPSRIVVPDYSTFHKVGLTGKEKQDEVSLDSKYILPDSLNNNEKPAAGTPAHMRLVRLRNSNHTENEEAPKDNGVNDIVANSKTRIKKLMEGLTITVNNENVIPVKDTKENSTLSCDADPFEWQSRIFPTRSTLEELKNFAESLKLGPVEVCTKPMKPKRGRTLFNCKITVNKQDFLSYPNDFFDAESAEKYCAQKALDELTEKHKRNEFLLLSIDKDVKERIPPLLRQHFQGIWSWQVEADYIDKYHEQLPINWLEIIDSCDCVAVEKIQDKYVLRYCKPGSALQKGKVFGTSAPIISVPSNTIQFGEENRLCGQISAFIALNEIWCIQCDTPECDAYNKMYESLEKYYNENSNTCKATELTVGSYYIANADSTWYRVKILEEKDDKVSCFLIDYGDEYLVDRNDLYIMKREYATSPAQAFLCRLAGLEDLYDSNIPAEKLYSYIARNVIVEAVDGKDDPDNDQSIAVVLYDITDKNSINGELLRYVTIEEATPHIIDGISEVFVTHMTCLGDVYVQVHTKGFASLENLLKTLSLEIATSNFPAAPMTRLRWLEAKDRLYLLQNRDDQLYYRIKILDMSPDGAHAQIIFVDTGVDKIVSVAKSVFYQLDALSDVLHQFPAQCVKVRMALETIPENFVEIATKLMKLNSQVLLKIVNDVDNIPVGEFYRRSSDEEGLFCINKAIMMQMEIETRSNSPETPKGVKNRLKFLRDCPNNQKVPSGGSLQRPPLPKSKEFFGVHIPFAVNPWNFFVQPFDSRKDLDSMMTKLQEYSRNATFSPLSIEDILPGAIFATRHSDGTWYRVSVLKVINAGSISVFYCDFGYYASVTVAQLIPLIPEFTVLPYQAMKAKLSGIKPKKNKWSMQDCEFFIALIRKKSFVAAILDIENDELYESDSVLKIILVDTSAEEDVFIESELIKKGIAVRAD